MNLAKKTHTCLTYDPGELLGHFVYSTKLGSETMRLNGLVQAQSRFNKKIFPSQGQGMAILYLFIFWFTYIQDSPDTTT
jgi:hypothetical protein